MGFPELGPMESAQTPFLDSAEARPRNSITKSFELGRNRPKNNSRDFRRFLLDFRHFRLQKTCSSLFIPSTSVVAGSHNIVRSTPAQTHVVHHIDMPTVSEHSIER